MRFLQRADDGIPVPQTLDGIEPEPMHGTLFAASLTDKPRRDMTR